MGPLLFMQSVIDQNVIMWRIPVLNVCHPNWVHCYVECICWYLIHFTHRSWDLEHLKLSCTHKWRLPFFSKHTQLPIIYNAHKTDNVRNFCLISHQKMRCYNSFILEDVLLKPDHSEYCHSSLQVSSLVPVYTMTASWVITTGQLSTIR